MGNHRFISIQTQIPQIKWELRAWMNLLEMHAEEYDIITISETWLQPNINNEDLQLEGFQSIVRKDRVGDPMEGSQFTLGTT